MERFQKTESTLMTSFLKNIQNAEKFSTFCHNILEMSFYGLNPKDFKISQMIKKFTWKTFFVGSLNIHRSVSLYEMTFIEIER